MIKKTLFSAFLIGTATIIVPANAAKEVSSQTTALGIVATVGEKAISSFDVNNRIKFIIATTGISASPEMIAGIKAQVLRNLIDESLQMQEAEKLGIKTDDSEVAQAIKTIEVGRGMPVGAIASMLSSKGVPQKTFEEQIRAQVTWNKLLSRNVRPKIKIGDDEVKQAAGHISAAPAKQEKQAQTRKIKDIEIAVINLPIEKKEQIAEVKKLADKLYGELKKGANFEEIARQFSAGSDGKSFRIRPEQLESSVLQILQTTPENSITSPIRTNVGYSIIKLLNVRVDKIAENKSPENKQSNEEKPAKEFEISFKEIVLKLKETASNKDADVLLQIGEAISKNPGGCEEKGIAGISGLDDFDIDINMRKAPASELPSALRSISETLKIGDISTPFASAEGIKLYMLCGKNEIAGAKPADNNIVREALFRQKFEIEAGKYLRDLRRGAFINIRN